jgi:hypothetical protein
MGQAKEANDLGTRTRDKMCVGKLQKEEEEEETKLLYFLKLRKKKRTKRFLTENKNMKLFSKKIHKS